jgi:hypothetical protein
MPITKHHTKKQSNSEWRRKRNIRQALNRYRKNKPKEEKITRRLDNVPETAKKLQSLTNEFAKNVKPKGLLEKIKSEVF